MTSSEGYFQHDGIPCATSIQGENLMVKGFLENGSPDSVLTIPFLEILSIKYVAPEDLSEKRTLGLKRKTRLPHISIKTIKRYKDHRWRLHHVRLKSQDQNLCQRWAKTFAKKLTEYQAHRPKFLLVFVNPYGGNGSAKNVYDKKVKPVFDEADIKIEVITTSFRHHAKSYIESNDLSDYDGIIAVGGDGMLNEVVNGLISKTQSSNRISVHAGKGEPRNCPKFLRPDLRVGVIPAGSTDCVSYVTQGINDAETSALHIALGDSHPVDVVSLHNAEGVFQQFSMSMTGYGYFGDTLRHSENYRWMGPPRYAFGGASVFLRNKSYSGDVHYLSADDTEDPTSSSFCRTPCTICQDGLTNSETPLFTPSSSVTDGLTMDGRSGAYKEEVSEIDCVMNSEEVETLQMENGIVCKGENDNKDCEFQECEDKQTCSVLAVVTDAPTDGNQSDPATEKELIEATPEFIIEESRNEDAEDILLRNNTGESDENILHSTRPGSLNLVSSQEHQYHEDWKVISGDFMSVKGVAMSCACEKSPLGLSPYSHLSDGAIDLIVVRSCSRFEFLRYMLALAGKSDRFDFPYVEVYRVKAFQFIPASPCVALALPLVASAPTAVTPVSATDTSCSDSIHISLDNLSVKYHKRNKKKNRIRGLKRSQSMGANKVSTWNSDGEIVSDPNMTVRVHRGLILMFCRGVEDKDR